MKADSTLIPSINANCLMPTDKNTKSRPKSATTTVLIIMQVVIVAIDASTKLIPAMIKLSLKKIPNTSEPLAPSALRMPISRFLYEIEVDMKFISSREANIAIPRANHIRMLATCSIVLPNFSSTDVDPF